jgi:hypothetical protein
MLPDEKHRSDSAAAGMDIDSPANSSGARGVGQWDCFMFCILYGVLLSSF